MKKSMVDYISALSKKDYSVLKDIVKKKYDKFTELYLILKEYSDVIEDLKYHEDSNRDRLKIEATVNCSDIEELISCLKNSVPDDGGDVDITYESNKVTLIIIKTEKF